MVKPRWGRVRAVAALVVAATMVTVPLASTEAWAGRRSEKIKAKINGKRFKANVKPSIVATFDPGLDVLTVVGIFQRVRRTGSGQVKTLMFSVNVDLETATVPLTVPAFNTLYGEAQVGLGGASSVEWGGEGVTVTIKKFDGERLIGTFEGSIPPGSENPGGPAEVVRGKFKVLLENLPA